ncbi:hypothetical protein BT67DRAFT_291075 [Trichocladium antarcticum]|uniref:Uncharacterized protein n=1 Tax=Trichocladium antarcticum TaxID=1450529 RepID=A0AAN6ZEM9_9PEZI|nr:hypothetical protein BT67DRAFT_291075 [Trichocladium antarcticum]
MTLSDRVATRMPSPEQAARFCRLCQRSAWWDWPERSRTESYYLEDQVPLCHVSDLDDGDLEVSVDVGLAAVGRSALGLDLGGDALRDGRAHRREKDECLFAAALCERIEAVTENSRGGEGGPEEQINNVLLPVRDLITTGPAKVGVVGPRGNKRRKTRGTQQNPRHAGMVWGYLTTPCSTSVLFVVFMRCSWLHLLERKG